MNATSWLHGMWTSRTWYRPKNLRWLLPKNLLRTFEPHSARLFRYGSIHRLSEHAGKPKSNFKVVRARGRTPAEMAVDAEKLFERVSRSHFGATSCLTYYEVEEALY